MTQKEYGLRAEKNETQREMRFYLINFKQLLESWGYGWMRRNFRLFYAQANPHSHSLWIYCWQRQASSRSLSSGYLCIEFCLHRYQDE